MKLICLFYLFMIEKPRIVAEHQILCKNIIFVRHIYTRDPYTTPFKCIWFTLYNVYTGVHFVKQNQSRFQDNKPVLFFPVTDQTESEQRLLLSICVVCMAIMFSRINRIKMKKKQKKQNKKNTPKKPKKQNTKKLSKSNLEM